MRSNWFRGQGLLWTMAVGLGCGGVAPGLGDDTETEGDVEETGDGSDPTTAPPSVTSASGSTGATSATSATTDPSDGGEDTSGGEETGDPPPECEGADSVTCYGGPLGTLNVGVCAAGIQSCEEGMWSECVGEVQPADEVCNGEDDDCDGETDEGCECIPGQTQPCYTGPNGTQGVGVCSDGEQTCEDPGVWGDCEDDVVPDDEACNGADDDCDGAVDETCDCTPGETQSCYSGPNGTQGVGTCAAGSQSCGEEGTWEDCTGDVTPVAETCDGSDEDCDGQVDDIALGDACDTGDEGECAVGQEACTDGELVCEETVSPVVEICDDLDNDCDGETDEDLEGDPILLSGDLDDAWSTAITLVGSYPASSAGTVPGRLHESDDVDWFTVFAQEQVFDVIGDTPVVGTVSLESPGDGFSYEVCACWSTSTTFCAKTQGGATQVCATSDDGNTASVNVQMAMVLGADDSGYLDVVVRTDNPTAVGCDLYEVGWFVTEE